MKFRLVETIGLHWGDLDKGIKAEQRRIGLHGTGHFGTGFYLVNKENYVDDQGRLKKDYNKDRPIYEIDTSSYNLFKPRGNEDAYDLHDALLEINRAYDKSMLKNLDVDIDKASELEKEEWYEKQDELYSGENNRIDTDIIDTLDFDDFDLDDLINLPDDYFIDQEDKQGNNSQNEEDYKDRFDKIGREFVKEHGLEDFVSWYHHNDIKNPGIIDNEINKAIENKWENLRHLNWAIGFLSQEFNLDRKSVIYLLNKIDESKQDTNSTQFIKLLGYDGIDVTHLGKDSAGYSGLDNFTYGTVIYDLKPNTYKKILEPIGYSRVGELA